MSFTVSIFKYKTDLGNLPTSAIVKTAVGRPYLCFILALKASYCNTIAKRLQNSRFFFSEPVKKSVKRGVRVLLARSKALEPYTPVGRVRRERLSPVSLSVFSPFQTFCLTARAYLNTQNTDCFRLQSKLQDTFGYFQTDRNQEKQRNREKGLTSLQQPKRTAQTIIFDPRPGRGQGLEGRGELKLSRDKKLVGY